MRTVIREAFRGWGVVTYRDELRQEHVVKLTVSDRSLAAETSAVESKFSKLASSASVEALAEKIVGHRRRMGLRRYGRKGR